MSTTDPTEYFEPYTLTQTLTGHKRAISSVKFSKDGGLLASSAADKTLRTYSFSNSGNAPSFSFLHEFTGHDLGVSDVAFSADSRYLASGSDDKTVRLWDSSTGISDSEGRVSCHLVPSTWFVIRVVAAQELLLYKSPGLFFSASVFEKLLSFEINMNSNVVHNCY